MNRTLQIAVVGGIAVLSVCAVYYFIVAPIRGEKELDDCLHYAYSSYDKDDCYRRYGK